MTTKLISLAEYRSNLSSLWKEAQEKNIRYIVMVRSEAVFEVNPIRGNIFDTLVPRFEELPDNEVTPDIKAKLDSVMQKQVSELRNI